MFRSSIIFYNVGLFQALNLCLLRKPLHVRRVFPGRGQLCDHLHAPYSSSPTNAGCLSRLHVNALERPAFISTNPFCEWSTSKRLNSQHTTRRGFHNQHYSNLHPSPPLHPIQRRSGTVHDTRQLRTFQATFFL